ncbi:MAG: sensor histidine kinase [Gemmatimonadaceae bacterium]
MIQRARAATLIFGIWTLLGLWAGSQYHLQLVAAGQLVEHLFQPFRIFLASFWLWAAFTPLVVWLARRFRLSRGTLLRNLPLHLVFFLLLAALDVAVDELLRPYISALPRRAYLPTYVAQLTGNVYNYAVIVAVTYVIDYARRYRERRVREARLEEQLTRARLDVIQMQLQPHFLFNTLNAIAELVNRDPAVAERIVLRLGDLLRQTLNKAGTPEVPLRDELEFLDAYLDMERVRFRDNLLIFVDVDPQALDAYVPTLILQPLVENAIRHGIAASAPPAKIDISAQRLGGSLAIEVRDNGKGIDGWDGQREGIGLASTRSRLAALYGSEYRFDLHRGNPGTIARMVIPFRESTGPEAASDTSDLSVVSDSNTQVTSVTGPI